MNMSRLDSKPTPWGERMRQQGYSPLHNVVMVPCVTLQSDSVLTKTTKRKVIVDQYISSLDTFMTG